MLHNKKNVCLFFSLSFPFLFFFEGEREVGLEVFVESHSLNINLMLNIISLPLCHTVS